MTTPDDGREVEVSNPDRILFPAVGVTKGEVVAYYRRVAPLMLPQLRGRPVVVERFTDRIDRGGFYQRNVPAHAPDWLRRVERSTADGGVTRYPLVDDAAGLAFLANQGAVVVHTLLDGEDAPDHPVELLFDLDPAGDDDREAVRDAARLLRAELDELGLAPRVKSSGSRGLHLHCEVVGPADFDLSREVAMAVAERVVARHPDRFTVAFHKAERRGRLFIDVLRNGRAAHAVAPYSLRARPEAPIAVPLSWDEALSPDFRPRRITLANVFRRLGQVGDVWAGHPKATVPLAEVRVPR
jgi:bifunctional non-homologous end joining protein LigD